MNQKKEKNWGCVGVIAFLLIFWVAVAAVAITIF